MDDYNKTGASLAWRHPDYPNASFTYLITIWLLQFGGILHTLNVIVKREEDPFIFINLKGHECESLGITVSVDGEEEEAATVNITYPSCEFKNLFFRKGGIGIIFTQEIIIFLLD